MPLPGLRRRRARRRTPSTWSPRSSPSRQLTDHAPVDVVGACCASTCVRNPGAAFSTGTSYTLVLTFVGDRRRGRRCCGSVRPAGERPAGRSASGFLLAGVLGNLTDRIFRAPGLLRGPRRRLPRSCRTGRSSTSPTCCIDVAGSLIIIQAWRGHRHRRGARRRAPRARRPARDGPAVARSSAPSRPGRAGRRARRRRDRPDVRPLPHPGRRPDRRGPRQRRRAPAGQVRPGARPARCSTSTIPRGRRPARGACRRWSRASGSSTTTTSIVVLDKPVGVAVHPSARAGPARPSSGTCAAAGFRIATSGAPSGRGSCSASTSARPA